MPLELCLKEVQSFLLLSDLRKQKQAVRNVFDQFNQDCIQILQTQYHSVFLQSTLDLAGTCTPRSLPRCPHCVCAEPPCAGSPRWDKETPDGRAPDNVLQTE